MRPSETPALAADEVEASLEEILASPPFDEPRFDELLVRFADWYKNLGELHASDPVLFWGALAGLSVLLAFLLWHLSVSLRSVWRAIRRAREPAAAAVVAARRFDLTSARAALAHGDFRAAIELSWGAAIGAWGVDPLLAETPRSQARELLTHLPVAHMPTVRDLLRLHERACYADEAMDAAEAEGALVWAEAIGGAAA